MAKGQGPHQEWWDSPDRPRCIAQTSDGSGRCKRLPIKGGTVCPYHGGSAPAVRKAAQARIMAAADLGAATIINLVNDKKTPPPVRLNAARDLLDRAGLAPKQQVEVEVKRYEQLLEAGDLVIDLEPLPPQGEITAAPEYADELEELI